MARFGGTLVQPDQQVAGPNSSLVEPPQAAPQITPQQIPAAPPRPRFGGTLASEDTLNDFQNNQYGGFLETLTADVDTSSIGALARDLTKQNMRPVLQGTGATFGVMAGTSLGPAGEVAGGALGFAIADDVADLIENWLGWREPQSIMFELGEAGQKLYEGFMAEGAGAAAGPALGMTAEMVGRTGVAQKLMKIKSKLPPLRASSAKKKVGKVLMAPVGDRHIIAQNIEEAEALENIIPGLKFNLGTKTADGRILAVEKGLTKESSEYANELAKLQESNLQAVKDFLEKQKGPGTPADARKVLESQKIFAEQGTMVAKKRTQMATEALQQPPGTTGRAGEIITDYGGKFRKEAKKRASKLYESIGVEEAPTDKVIDAIEDVAQTFERREALSKTFPEDLRDLYIELLQAHPNKRLPSVEKELPGLGSIQGLVREANVEQLTPVSYKDLEVFRKQLRDKIEEIDAFPKFAKSRQGKLQKSRLAKVADVIEETIDEGVKNEKYTAKAIKEARAYYQANVYEPFESGRMGEVFANKVKDTEVAGHFFQQFDEGLAAAQQFKKAFGTDMEANIALRRAIQKDLLENATDPATKEISATKLNNWLHNHKAALDEYGMTRDFDSLYQARMHVEEAAKYEKAFNASAAGKALKADPERMVKTVLSGNDRAQKMLELMRSMRGDKKAINGIQNLLIEELQNYGIKNADSAEKLFREYDGVIRAAFADNPAKIRAMETYQNAIKRLFPDQGAIKGDFDDFKSVIGMLGRKARMSRTHMANFYATAEKVITHFGRKSAVELMSDASLDPNFAFAFVQAMRERNLKLFEYTLRHTLTKTYLSQPEDEDVEE